jgi:hypothetical protein
MSAQKEAGDKADKELAAVKAKLEGLNQGLRKRYARQYRAAQNAYNSGTAAQNAGEWDAARAEAEKAAAALERISGANIRNIVRKEKLRDFTRRLSLGTGAETSFATPWALVNINGSFRMFPYSYIEAGCDFGFAHGYAGREDAGYYSFTPTDISPLPSLSSSGFPFMRARGADICRLFILTIVKLLLSWFRRLIWRAVSLLLLLRGALCMRSIPCVRLSRRCLSLPQNLIFWNSLVYQRSGFYEYD